MPKYRVWRHGTGGRIDQPGETSQKIPNPIPGYKAEESSIEWGFSVSKEFSLGVRHECRNRKGCGQEYRGAAYGVSDVDRP
jgi:hypothetical protein